MSMVSGEDIVGSELGPRLLSSARLLLAGLFQQANENSQFEFDVNQDLGDLHDHGLKVLFRMVLLLVGESNRRLPRLDEMAGENLSMNHLMNLMEEKMNSSEQWPSDSHRLWTTFQNISHSLGRSSTTDNNQDGGEAFDLMFQSTPWDCLDVPDPTFSLVLQHLTHRMVDDGEQVSYHRLNYNGLEHKHIGSATEALLEHSSSITEKRYKMAEKAGWSILVELKPEEDPDENTVDIGEYALLAGNERASTGAHYSPPRIASHLAESSLGQLIEGRSSHQMLQLSICDPAMGSAALLIAAVQFLAQKYSDQVQSEIDAGDFEPGHTHGEGEWVSEGKKLHSNRWGGSDPSSEQAMIDHKRLIIERCIYGVDINPTAIYSAKVILWLESSTSTRPFVYLDSKLKCGNSIVGQRIFRA